MAHLKIYRFRKILRGWRLVCLLALPIMLVGVVLLGPAIRARYLLGELGTLRVGRSTFEDAERVAKTIGAKPYYAHCNPTTCAWGASVNNGGLPEWWRGCGETFSVSFQVKDSIVVRKVAGFAVGTAPFHPSGVLLDELEELLGGNTGEAVQTKWESTNEYRYFRFTASMTPEASTKDRGRYSAFNYSCFWRYKGCKDARELLPTADAFPSEK